MSDKKLLVVGCSFTEDCGFTPDNQQQFHWPHLLSNHYNYQLHNAGIGGSSNEEIFYRTSQLVATSQFELVVVLWSEIGRKWAYFEDNNIDDFTILNKGEIKGFIPVQDAAIQYAKLHFAYFNNQYINLKNWLLQIILLQTYCQQHNQNIIMAKGFENHIIDFQTVDYQQGFFNIEPIKYMLDFDGRPDHYIKLKIKEIKDLIDQIDQSNWINFSSAAFKTNMIDVADDDVHPGPLSNKNFYLELINHCDQSLFNSPKH